MLISQNASEDVKVTIDSLQLKVLNYSLNENLWRELNTKLDKESMRYYFSKPDIDIYTIPAGEQTKVIENVGVGVSISVVLSVILLFQFFVFQRKFRLPYIFWYSPKVSLKET